MSDANRCEDGACVIIDTGASDLSISSLKYTGMHNGSSLNDQPTREPSKNLLTCQLFCRM